jgi:lipoyl(octanoyl) transferase
VSQIIDNSLSLCCLFSPDQVPYGQAWDWQRTLVAQRKQNPDLPDVLILLQHPPVYTLGQGASLEFIKFDPQAVGVELHRTERGGEVTYHGPGQLVAYPILNLQRHQPDLHWYLRQLEGVVIEVLARLGLVGERIPGLTGVWLGGEKVAAIGIKVSRWITMHGFALNVCPDLQRFGTIVPCGIGDRPVGSLHQWLPQIQMATVQELVVEVFAEYFHLKMVPTTREELELEPGGNPRD